MLFVLLMIVILGLWVIVNVKLLLNFKKVNKVLSLW